MRKLSAIVLSLWSISVVATAQQTSPPVASDPASDKPPAPRLLRRLGRTTRDSGGIHWGSLMREWWTWVAIEQTERIVKESKTRNQLSGPFFRDWFNTVSDYHFDNWNDGGKIFTSYLAHPTQGAVAEAIFWQNNDHVRFSEQDFHSADLPERSPAGLRIRHRRCGAVENGTPQRVQYRERWPSGSLVGQGLQAAPHSLRRPDRRERYGDERGGRDGLDRRLPMARQARSETDRKRIQRAGP